MNFDKLFNILGLIVGVALITTIVAHQGSASVIRSFGDSFSGAIRAAEGK